VLLLILTVLSVTCLLPPLGSVLLWQRYNYLNDGLIHACIFSNVVSYFCGTDQIASMMIVAVIFSSMVFLLRHYSDKNAVVSLTSSALLSSAIIFSSYFQERTIFETMMFGDIFSIEWDTLYIIIALIVLMVVFLTVFLNSIVIISLDKNIAHSKKLLLGTIEYITLIMMALIIAVTIKLLGAFLIGSLLIIPAMAGRLISVSPLAMIVRSSIIGMISGISGVAVSFFLDWPLSPSVSVSAIVIYVVLLLLVGSSVKKSN
jgi:zinc transport system permease protein